MKKMKHLNVVLTASDLSSQVLNKDLGQSPILSAQILTACG